MIYLALAIVCLALSIILSHEGRFSPFAADQAAGSADG